MSVYSTLNITKSKAKSHIMGHIVNKLDDNEFLAYMMDELLKDRLYNCLIVADHDEDNQDYLL